MMGRRHSNTSEDKPGLSYAALCLMAMRSSSSASLADATSSSAGYLAYRMQLFKERLMRQAFISPKYRGPYWRVHKSSSTFWRSVEIMGPIDEVIEVINEDDKYGPRYVFDEPDADGRWACFVDNVHRQRQTVVWDPTVDDISWDLRFECQQRSLADKYCFRDLDTDSDDSDDSGLDTEQAGRSSRLGFDGPTSSISATNEDFKGAHIRPEINSPNSRQKHNDENDRPAGTTEEYSSSENLGWEALQDDSESSGDDEETEAEEAETERISKLFEDFPTCIQKTERVSSFDDGYGAIAMSDPAKQWTPIEAFKLPRRIREYLADLSIVNAQGSRPNRNPETKLDDSDPHRWLFETPRNEFVFDMLAMKMWYRYLDHLLRQAGLPYQRI